MSADEMTELENPFVLQNFTAMLQKIRQEDGGTWEALGLMNELKITSPVLTIVLKKDQEGRPNGSYVYDFSNEDTCLSVWFCFVSGHPEATIQQFWLALHCPLCER
jgi:hypothetical protein